MKKIICLILCAAMLFCFCGCKENDAVATSSQVSLGGQSSSQLTSAESSSSILSESSQASSGQASSDAASSEVQKPVLTLEDKISRLFIVKPAALNLDPKNDSVIPGNITKVNSNIKTALQKYKVSGVILFDNNLESRQQLNTLTADFKAASSLPFFVSVDEEGGGVSRVINKFGYANPGSALYLVSTENAQKAYSDITAILASHGFNLNFAPVADIYTNPKNKVIGSRAFGRDPETVSKLLLAAMKGHKSLPHCVKHFPGHGDTSADTHDGGVTLTKTWEELLKCEIVPFKAAIKQGCDMIMASHITLPNVTKDKLPTSLSYEMITEKLRGELGYEGVIITDSMAMGAISKNYSSGDSSVLAIKAGVDIILCPSNLAESHAAILKAVKNGEISEERIDESVKRIDTLFEKYNIS